MYYIEKQKFKTICKMYNRSLRFNFSTPILISINCSNLVNAIKAIIR